MSNSNLRSTSAQTSPAPTESLAWRLKKRLRNGAFKLSNRLFGSDLTHRSKLAGGLLRLYTNLESRLSAANRKQAHFERANPDAPWFAPDSIPYVESLLKPDFVGFEWGSGRSSLWFARRVRHITCIEARRSWYEQVKSRVTAQNLDGKIDLRLREVTSEFNYDPGEIARYVGEIEGVADGSLDFITVDGHFREECLRRCLRKIRPGGLLILDNSDLPEFTTFHAVLQAENTRTFSNGIWETTIFLAPPKTGFLSEWERLAGRKHG